MRIGFKTAFIYLACQFSYVFASPEGGVVAQGGASISGQGSNQVTINQSTNKAIINWQTFDVGNGQSVTFNTPGANAATLNRISGNASQILGNVTSNGQLWLINPNGIMFGKNAQINVAGLVASTMNISDKDFLSGNYKLTQTGANLAQISNAGHINADGGYVAMLAPQIENTGIIEAKLGTVAMGAGTEATLAFQGNQLLNFAVGQGANVPMYDENGRPVAALNQAGTIEANGGQVLLTADSINSMLDQSINVSGVIQADTVEDQPGKIVLLARGQNILNNAQVSAKGGKVEVIGQDVGLFGNTHIDATGGEIRVGRDVTDPNAFEAEHTVIGQDVSLKAHFVETSGNYLSEQSSHIIADQWLLDPYNVTISDATTSGGFFNGDTIGPNSFIPTSTATVSASTITSALNAGTSVTITTAGGGSDAGNITLSSNINTNITTGAPTLTLDASNNIIMNAAISDQTAGNKTLNVTLNAGGGISFVSAGGVGAPPLSGVYIGGTLTANAAGGNITQDSNHIIQATTTNLTASGYIDLSEANNVFGTINATAGGKNSGVGIHLNDTGMGLALGTLDTHSDNGNISITASGELQLGQNGGAYLNAGTGAISLTGLSIDDNGQNNETIAAGTTTLSTVGYVQLDGNNYFGTLNASVGGSSNGVGIDIVDINPLGLHLGTVETTGMQSAIHIEEKSGDINLAGATVQTDWGNISLTADAGSITGYGDTTEKVIAQTGGARVTTTLTAKNNIELLGTQNQLATLEATTTGVGDINLVSQGGVLLTTLMGGSNTRNISVTSTEGDVFLGGTIQNGQGVGVVLTATGTIALTGAHIQDGGWPGTAVHANTLDLTATDTDTYLIRLTQTNLSDIVNLGINLTNTTNGLDDVHFGGMPALTDLTGLTISTPSSALNVSDVTTFITANSQITPANITTFGLTSNSTANADISAATTEFSSLHNLTLGNTSGDAFALEDSSFDSSLQTLSLSADSLYLAPGGQSAGTLTLSDNFTLNLTATGNGYVMHNPNPTISGNNLHLNISLPGDPSNIQLGNFTDLTELSINAPNISFNLSDVLSSMTGNTPLTALSITSNSVAATDIKSAETTFGSLTSLALDNTNTTPADFTIDSDTYADHQLSDLALTTGGSITVSSDMNLGGNLSLTAGGVLTNSSGYINVNNLSLTGSSLVSGGGSVISRGDMNLISTAGDIVISNLQAYGNSTLNAADNITVSGLFDLGLGTVTATAGSNIGIANTEGQNNDGSDTTGTLTLGAITAGGDVTLSNDGTFSQNIAPSGDVNLTGAINAGADITITSLSNNLPNGGITNGGTINMSTGHTLTLETNKINNSGAPQGFYNNGAINGDHFIVSYLDNNNGPNGFTFNNAGTIGNGVDPFTLNINALSEDNSGNNVWIDLGTLNAGSTANNKGFNLNINTPAMSMTVEDVVNSYGLSTSSNIQSLSIVSNNTSDTDITDAMSGNSRLASLTGLSLENTTNAGFALSGGDYSQLTGGLSLTADGTGSITQSAVITSAPGTLSLNASSINLNNGAGNQLGNVSVVSSGAVTLKEADGGLLTLGSSSIGGGLTISSSGNSSVVQNGSLTVSLTTSIGVGSGDVTLNNSGNQLVGLVALDGATVSLNNNRALQLGEIAASGNLSFSASGDITQAAGITMTDTGEADFQINNGGTGAVDLSGTNDFDGSTVNVGGAGNVGNVTIVDSSAHDLVIGNVSANSGSGNWGDVSIGATGAVVLNGNIEGNQLTVSSVNSGITQNDTSVLTSHYSASKNSNYGVQFFTTTNGDQGPIVQKGSIYTYGSDVYFNVLHGGVTQYNGTSNTGLIDTTTHSTGSNTPGGVYYYTNGDAINLMGQNQLGFLQGPGGTMGWAGAIDINDVSALGLTLGDGVATGYGVQTNDHLNITSQGQITQNQALSVAGTTNITAQILGVSAQDITLNNADNDFGNSVVTLVGNVMTIQDANETGLVLGAVSGFDINATAAHQLTLTAGLSAYTVELTGTGIDDNTAPGQIDDPVSGSINAAAGVTLDAGVGDIYLSSYSNHFGAAVTVGHTDITSGAVSINADDTGITLSQVDNHADTQLGALTIKTAASDIGFSGELHAAGAVDLNAGWAGINLGGNGLYFNGQTVALAGGAVTVKDSSTNGLVLGAVTAGALDITANGNISQNAAMHLIDLNGESTAAFHFGDNVTAGQLTLDNDANILNQNTITVDHGTDSTIGNVILHGNDTGVTLGNMTLDTGDLTVVSAGTIAAAGAITSAVDHALAVSLDGGAITQTGGSIITHGGSLTIAGGGTGNIDLSSSSNQLGAVQTGSTLTGLTGTYAQIYDDGSALTVGSMDVGAMDLHMIAEASGETLTQSGNITATTGDVALNSSGDLTQTGSITTDGGAVVLGLMGSGNSRSINQNAAISSGAGNVQFNLGDTDTLTQNGTGAITTSRDVTVGSVQAGSIAVNLNGANDFQNITIRHTSQSNDNPLHVALTVNNDTNLTFGLSYDAYYPSDDFSSLNIATNGNVTWQGNEGLVVTGATTIDAGSGDITLLNDGEGAIPDFGNQLVTLTGAAVHIEDVNATGLRLGAVTASGDVNITASHNLTLTDTLLDSQASGAVNLTAGAADTLAVNGAILYNGANSIDVSLSGGTISQQKRIQTHGGSLTLSGGSVGGITLTTADLSANQVGTLYGNNLSGNVAVFDNGSSFNLGDISFSDAGTLTLQAAGDLTQNSGTTISTQGSAVNLESLNGDVNQAGAMTTLGGGVVLKTNVGAASITQQGTGRINTASAGNAPTYGAVEVQNGDANFGTWTVNLNGSTNNFQSLAIVNTMGFVNLATALTVNNQNSLAIGQFYQAMFSTPVDVLSSLNVTAEGDVTQLGSYGSYTSEALKVTGNTTVNAGGADITLANTDNDFGNGTVTLSGNDVQISDSNSTGLQLGVVTASTLTAEATHGIVLTDEINASTSVDLTADAGAITDGDTHAGHIHTASTTLTANGIGGSIDLEHYVDGVDLYNELGNLVSASATTTGGSITLLSRSLNLLGGVTADTVSLTAHNYGITDDVDHAGYIQANTTTLHGGDAGKVDLKNTHNSFGTLTATSAANLSTAIDLVNGSSDLTIASLTTTLGSTGGAGISVTSGGAIIVAGPIVADYTNSQYTGALTLTSTAGSITDNSGAGSIKAASVSLTADNGSIDLENTSNIFGTLNATTTGTGNGITVVDGNGSGLVLGSINAPGSLSITAIGDITQVGAINMTGNGQTTITAQNGGTAKNITLTNGSNDFGHHEVTLNGAGVTIKDYNSTGLILGGFNSAEIHATAAHQLTLNGQLNAYTVGLTGAGIDDSAQQGSIIAGSATLTTTGGSIDLQNSLNNFSTLSADTAGTGWININDSANTGSLSVTHLNTASLLPGDNVAPLGITLTSGGSLVLDGNITAGSNTVNLTAQSGSITDDVQTGSVVAGITNLTANDGAIDLENTNNSFGTLNASTTGTGNGITVVDGNNSGLALNTITSAGVLSVTASHGITDTTGRINSAGAVTLDGGVNQAINLNYFDQTYGYNHMQNVTLGSSGEEVGDVTLSVDTDGIALTMAGTSLNSLNLTTADGAVSQVGALNILTGTTIAAAIGNITLANEGNDFGNSVVALSGNEVQITDSNDTGLQLGAVTANTLTAKAKNGSITDGNGVGSITTTEGVTLDAGSSEISLTNTNNHFGTSNAVTINSSANDGAAGAVSLSADSSGIKLAQGATSLASLTVNTHAGVVTQSTALNVLGATYINTISHDITLTTADNNFHNQALTLIGGNLSLTDSNSAINIDYLQTWGNGVAINLTGTGGISDVGGGINMQFGFPGFNTASFNLTGMGDVNLSGDNAFNGNAVSIGGSGTVGAVTIDEGYGALVLGNITTADNLTVNSKGAISQLDPIVMTGTGKSASFNIISGGTGAVTLDAGGSGAVNVFNGNTVNVGGAGAIGDVTIDSDATALKLGNINTSGNLTVTAAGITGSGIVTAHSTTLTATSGGSGDYDGIKLTNVNNSFGTLTVTSNANLRTSIDLVNGINDLTIASATTIWTGGSGGGGAGLSISSGGSINITGPITADQINNHYTGAVTLTSSNGSITETGDSAAILAGSANLTAASDIDLENTSNQMTNGDGSVFASTANGNIMLVDANASGLALGDISTPGNLSVTAAGDLTQSDSSTVSAGGASSLDAGVHAIILDHAENAFTGIVTVGHGAETAGAVSLASSGALTVAQVDQNAQTRLTSLALTSGSGIAQSGALNVAGTSMLNATDDINLNNTHNIFDGAVSGSAANFNIQSDSALILGNITATGQIYAIAALDLTQAGNLISGDSDGSAIGVELISSGGSITQAHAINTQGAAVALTAEGMGESITQNGSITAGTGSTWGNVNVTSGEAFTQNAGAVIQGQDITLIADFNGVANPGIVQDAAGSMIAAGTVTLNTSGYDVSLLGTANQFGAVAGAGSLGNVMLQDGRDSGLILGNLAVTGTLGVTTLGSLTQSGFLNVAGTTTLNSAGDITLNNTSNDFGGVAITSGNNVTLNDLNALALGESHIRGTLDVTTQGAITQSGALNVAGSATLTAGGGTEGVSGSDIILGEANHFNGPVALSGANISIDNITDLEFADVTASGDFNTTVTAAITQEAGTAFNIGGSSNINAESSDIILGNVANEFDGAVTAIGGNISLAMGGTFSLNQVTASGDLILAANQLNNLGGAHAIRVGDGDVWNIYLTHLNGNTFGGLESHHQAIWGTSYPTAISQSGNRYIFATTENLSVTPENPIPASMILTKPAGTTATLPQATPVGVTPNYQVTGFVDASLYGGVFTQDNLGNVTISGLSYTSDGVPDYAAPGKYDITMTGAGATSTGYGIAYNSQSAYGSLTVGFTPAEFMALAGDAANPDFTNPAIAAQNVETPLPHFDQAGRIQAPKTAEWIQVHGQDQNAHLTSTMEE